MERALFSIPALALAAGVAFAGIVPAPAMPAFAPVTASSRPDVVRVQDSRIIRRDGLHRDGGAWKKRRHHRDMVQSERHHRGIHKAERRDRHDREWTYRPRATPKYAYDAYGNFRVYDDDGWKRHRKWDGDHEKHERRMRVARRTFTSTVPSPELQEILTAAPD